MSWPITPPRFLEITALILGCTLMLAKAETILATAKKVPAGAKIDGVGDDACWKAVTSTSVTLLGIGELRDKNTPSNFKAVHDGTSIYMLVVWDDKTENRNHKSFTWNAKKGFYAESTEVEDQFSVAWEMKGAFTANMLTPVRAKYPWSWDVWQWGAARTDPLSLAKDMIYYFSSKQLKNVKPQKQHRSRQGIIWIIRPEDKGSPIYKAVTVNRRKKTKDVLQPFQLGKPTDSAADVKAKGVWADGKWTIEFSRKLNTLQKDDKTLMPGKSYKVAFASFDQFEAHTHYASKVVRLKIE